MRGEGDVHKIIKLKTFPLTFIKLMGLPLFVQHGIFIILWTCQKHTSAVSKAIARGRNILQAEDIEDKLMKSQ